ncbi:UNVERIFIED_CONTAM: phytosulfokine3 [Sesamum latifolium]|uniref:Phytosulfokine n=1 Tax=Sesamum latifolium TaxID=2727402 RepID=A0AAW2X7V9_9LAMI
MSKATAFFIVALLLFSLCSASRPTPTAQDKVEAKNEVKVEAGQVEESCQGIGEDECLMRRTLAAHLDYIYTQHHKP